eukprot:TRINITY_DN22923_c0_g1_i1.p1 TRINITY_DN22923_c0_g1~~TRINITY_DN22923_c0_g1_i1.p1  ORF type:complete len:413 (-),score=37.59 TRINITY_DN22923_c0_g1_i1:192-1430(-)
MSRIVAHTSEEVAEVEAEWAIDRYEFLKSKIEHPENRKDAFNSDSVFVVSAFRFRFKLFPYGATGSDDGYVALHIGRVDMDPRSVHAKYGVKVINQLGVGDEEGESNEVRRFATGDVWGFNNMIPAEVLEDERRGFKQNDRIIIRGWMQISLGTKTNSARDPRELPPSLTNTVSTDFGELLRSGEGSDVTLRCGDVAIPCHSLILSTRSTVFRQMLQLNMKEADSREVHIVDFEPVAVKWFVHYLYTGELDPEAEADKEALCHLLQIAHKYETTHLAEYCEALVSRSLTVENVAERLCLADMYNRPELRVACLDFITRTPGVLADVQSTDGFEHLRESRPKLLGDILAANSGLPQVRKRRLSSDELEFPPCSNWSRLSVGCLKRACKERGLSITGNKDALVQRLTDRNADVY